MKFLPSYKHDLQSDNYDSSSKMRTPSWTVSVSNVLVLVQFFVKDENFIMAGKSLQFFGPCTIHHER